MAVIVDIVMIATLCLSTCPTPLSESKVLSSGGAATLTVAFAVPASRTVTASSGDLAAAISSLSVAVVDGSSTTVASATGISYGAGVVTTFGPLAPGAYTITANALNAASALIATGSTAVSVGASGNQNVTVNLAYGPNAVAGGFSLALSWPIATGLGYVSATIDDLPIAVPSVSSDAVNYTATLAASNLSGGVHLLAIKFKTSAAATPTIGPFVETVNIWGGVTSTCWIDAGGNPVHTRPFAQGDFSSSNADLAGLGITGATLAPAFAAGTTSYALTSITGTNIGFSAVAVSGNQDVTYTWNGIGGAWQSHAATTYASPDLALVPGVNTLVITVAATDKQTTKTYTATCTMVSAANLASALAANLAGSFILTENSTITSPIGNSAAPFTGTLDGDGHEITLAISGSANYTGIFAKIGSAGTVKDLKLSGSVSGGYYTGALAAENEGTITGCTSSVAVSTVGYFAGGLVACNTGTIAYCSASGDVVSSGPGGSVGVGGLVGINGSGSLFRCYATGNVTSQSSNIGGLVGSLSEATVDQCYATGTVTNTGTESHAGGLAGQIFYASTRITNSYARGAVTGNMHVGGLTSQKAGTISNCYATGSYTAASYGGYLVGFYSSGTITGCYVANSGDATYYLSTLGSAVPEGWDTGIWGQSASINDGYPYLVYFGADTKVP